MKNHAFQGLWIVLVTFVVFLVILSFGCSHQPYPSEAYLGEYIAKRMEYNTNNNKETLMKSNKDWNMYLSVRSWEADSER